MFVWRQAMALPFSPWSRRRARAVRSTRSHTSAEPSEVRPLLTAGVAAQEQDAPSEPAAAQEQPPADPPASAPPGQLVPVFIPYDGPGPTLDPGVDPRVVGDGYYVWRAADAVDATVTPDAGGGPTLEDFMDGEGQNPNGKPNLIDALKPNATPNYGGGSALTPFLETDPWQKPSWLGFDPDPAGPPVE